MMNSRSVYEEEVLPRNHPQSGRLEDHIRRTIPSGEIEITSIRKVKNKYLSLAFEIKEREMRPRNGTPCEIEEYLHATAAANIPSILKGNLNWRLVRRSRYGRGTSFTHSAAYANRYCNNMNGVARAFIFCDVLLGKTRIVDENDDKHPPKNFHSYLNRRKLVLVKFDDFTYNPKFVVYYEERVQTPGFHNILYRQRYPNQSNERNRRYQNEQDIDPIMVVIQGIQAAWNYYNLQETNHNQNQQSHALLRSILQTPLGNEEFLRRIARMIDSERLPNRNQFSRVIYAEAQCGRELQTLPIADKSNIRFLSPQMNYTTDVYPTTQSGLTNMSRSPTQIGESIGRPDGLWKKIFIIFVFIILSILFVPNKK